MTSDFKAPRRVKASPAEWVELRASKLGNCRCCGRKWLNQLHHLVPRGMGGTIGGDDVADNLVPVCPVCHALIENRDPVTCRQLRNSLTFAEMTYVLQKKGEPFLDARYPVAA